VVGLPLGRAVGVEEMGAEEGDDEAGAVEEGSHEGTEENGASLGDSEGQGEYKKPSGVQVLLVYVCWERETAATTTADVTTADSTFT
jgi:hypothetical protein